MMSAVFFGFQRGSVMSVRGLAVLLACLGLLAGCGGGGGGGTGSPAPGNPLPRIVAQTFNGTEDTVLTAQIVASDPGDTLTFASAAAPASGALTVSAAGSFTYTPNENFNGSDSFTARVTDSSGQSATATITLMLAAVNDAPLAVNDVLAVVSADQLAVLANDVDVDGDPLTVTLMGQAFAGTASVTAGNTVQVALPAGFKGFTKFDYRITDAAGASADATTLVFVGIEPFKVVNFRQSLDPDVQGFYVHDLFGERRATEANAVGLSNFDQVRFAAGGGALAYLGVNTSTNITEVRYLDLTDPAARTRLVNEPRSGFAIGEIAISRDGRYVAYQVSSVGLGSWIELFDAESAGFGTRLSLPADAQLTAGQAQFNDAGTFVYYNGCAPSMTSILCTVHRASVASRVVERVAPVLPGATATLLMPATRDDDRVVFQNVITHNNAPWEFPLMMSRANQPDVATPLGNMAPGEISNFPLGLFADGSRVFMSIFSGGAPLRSVVASLTQPGDVVTIGGPGLQDGDIYLPRALRADSGAVLYRRCGGGSCQVYETRLDDPATSVPIGVPVAVTNSAYWQAQYSADGERMIYLREESNPSPFRRVVEVTRRDSPGETIHVTPNDGAAYLFELDASGRVVVASMRDDDIGARLTLTNVDQPLVSLDLGQDAARYRTYAVLPR
jgi:VCBS repeat-containing protein